LVQKAHPDVVLGGGLADFLPEEDGGHRKDHRDLVEELGDAGYEVVHSLEELAEVPRWRRPKLFGLFADAELPFADEVAAHDDQPTLADMVRRGVELLQFHRGGYLLIVDAALTRKAAERNDEQSRAAETLELDRAVAEALSYAGAKSMILVCSDVAIRRSVPAPTAPETTAADSPAQDGAQGPTPTVIPGEADPGSHPIASSPSLSPSAEPTTTGEDEAVASRPAVLLNETTGATTAEDVVAFGTGLGANTLHGIVESTVIFDTIRDNL
jgi:alkaline phosphatase